MSLKPKIKLIFTNRKIIAVITLLVIILTLTTIVIPFLLLNITPQSGIGNFVFEYMYVGYFFIPVLLYIYYIGIYLCRIKIDSYIIDIRSIKTILGVSLQPSYIDVAHNMLIDFAFFSHPFSFNKILMIKIATDTGKKVAKRFKITCMFKKEEERIKKALMKILIKNQNDRK